MLRPSQVKKIRKLFADGRSLREIARKMRLARNTVDDVAHGRRYGPSPLPDGDPLQCLGPPVRCAKCGGMVYPPCRLCRVRAIKARKLFLAKMRRADAYCAAG